MKVLFSLFIVLSAAYAEAQLNNGLTAHWSFNQGDATDDWDSFDGLIDGATLTADRFGNPDQAYAFDGVDDKITFGQGNFDVLDQDFSYSIWLKTSTPQLSFVFTKGTISEMYGLMMGDLSTQSSDDSLSIYYRVSSDIRQKSVKIADGQWHHIVINHFHYDSTSVYLDNQYMGSDNTLFSSPYFLSDELTLGGNSSLNIPYEGEADDIRFYENRTLSPVEIDSLYNMPDPGVATANVNAISPIQISVFPNPTTDFVKIQSEERIEQIQIVSSLGKTILVSVQPETTTQELDLSDLAKGLYFVQVTTASGSQSFEVIKQ